MMASAHSGVVTDRHECHPQLSKARGEQSPEERGDGNVSYGEAMVLEVDLSEFSALEQLHACPLESTQWPPVRIFVR